MGEVVGGGRLVSEEGGVWLGGEVCADMTADERSLRSKEDQWQTSTLLRWKAGSGRSRQALVDGEEARMGVAEIMAC